MVHPAIRIGRGSVNPYVVAYLSDRRPLFIVRILHGARAPDEVRDELRDA